MQKASHASCIGPTVTTQQHQHKHLQVGYKGWYKPETKEF